MVPAQATGARAMITGMPDRELKHTYHFKGIHVVDCKRTTSLAYFGCEELAAVSEVGICS
jgi:hypothetical protein